MTEKGLVFMNCFKDTESKAWKMPLTDEIYQQGIGNTLVVEYAPDNFLLASSKKPHFVKVER